MYQALLTNRYLTTRVIPFVAVAAVALCVALVIVVVSVMTGFLNLVRESGRTLMGDVIVTYPISGISHYQELIETIERLPEAHAATPVVDSWGLLRMPYPSGRQKETTTVQVWGIEPESFTKVTGYDESLYWKPASNDESANWRKTDLRRRLGPDSLRATYEAAHTLRDTDNGRPGIVMGMHVSQANERQSDGSYEPMLDGHWWMPRFEVTLTVLPITADSGVIEPESHIFPVLNEFISGVYLIDSKRVMIPLEIGQDLMHLGKAEIVNEDNPMVVLGEDPAKATSVLVRAAEGIDAVTMRDAVMRAYDDFFHACIRDDTKFVKPPPRRGTMGAPGAIVQTWEEQQATFIGPIEKEREVMRTLFSLVYLVCAAMVLSIFWAIVYEKTRDIGILRSIGASRIGILWIFLRYGLIIGIVGSLCGLGLAAIVVHNLNHIHSALGDPPLWLAIVVMGLGAAVLIYTLWRIRSNRLLPILLGSIVTIALLVLSVGILLLRAQGGVVIWDPAVYYFREIPSQLDMQSVVIALIGGTVFSVFGAVLPAAKAADTDPVGALRYE